MDLALRGLSAVLMIVGPIVLGIVLTRRMKQGWRLLAIGAATFVASQVGHIPFNAALINPLLAQLGFPDSGPGLALAASAAVLGLSAGLFEEGARYLVYRFGIRSARSWGEGVMFGAGHGGGEAILVGVFAGLQHIQAYALRGQDLSTIVPPEQLEAVRAQLDAYWAAPPALSLLAPLERAFALTVQVSLALLVLQAFTQRGGPIWILAAIAWHAVVDGVAVYAGVAWGTFTGSTAGTLATEALVGLMAIISLGIILRLRPRPSPAGPIRPV
jgi:uncharacterized membrane protein YhfC